MTSKQYAENLFREHYAEILEYGDELSQECIVSILAIRASIITVEHLKGNTTDKCYMREFFDNVILELKSM